MDQLDRIYTADEASERLRISKRAIIAFGRNIGACAVASRKYLFSEADLLTIWQALRAEPVRYRGRAVHVPARQSLEGAYERLLKLVKDQQDRRIEERQKRKMEEQQRRNPK